MTIDPKITELLDKRLKAAEQKFLNSPETKWWKARAAHMLMAHGSYELCDCPEWNHGSP